MKSSDRPFETKSDGIDFLFTINFLYHISRLIWVANEKIEGETIASLTIDKYLKLRAYVYKDLGQSFRVAYEERDEVVKISTKIATSYFEKRKI